MKSSKKHLLGCSSSSCCCLTFSLMSTACNEPHQLQSLLVFLFAPQSTRRKGRQLLQLFLSEYSHGETGKRELLCSPYTSTCRASSTSLCSKLEISFFFLMCDSSLRFSAPVVPYITQPLCLRLTTSCSVFWFASHF